jgi:hypothetical protein
MGTSRVVDTWKVTPLDAFLAMPERAAARSFGDRMVWRKAHELMLAMYGFTETFPERESYGLAHQMRRAAVSLPANIARVSANAAGPRRLDS